jgi:NTE family protein
MLFHLGALWRLNELGQLRHLTRVSSVSGGSVAVGMIAPGGIGGRAAAAYRRHLFGDATLQSLPADAEGPRFVINATNLQSGDLWRFSRPFRP